MTDRKSESELESLSSQPAVRWKDLVPVYGMYSYAKDRLVDDLQVRDLAYGAVLLASHTIYLAVTLSPAVNLIMR
ncbi:hypothetical protein J4423_03220 [Candidatus Pacearchaeota archaeon]|nr:hypothetical protein [Candidatus Pacearchaeota archaeon]